MIRGGAAEPSPAGGGAAEPGPARGGAAEPGPAGLWEDQSDLLHLRAICCAILGSKVLSEPVAVL